MQTIGNFSLNNEGGFRAKIQFVYHDNDGNKIHVDGTDEIYLGVSKTADPGNYGVPDGAPVALYVFVVWGTDAEAEQLFTYQKGSSATANYTIKGNELENKLVLNSIG